MIDAFDVAIDDYAEFLGGNLNRSEATVVKYVCYLARLKSFLKDKDQDHLTATQASLDEFTGMFLIMQGMRPSGRKPVISGIRGFFAWLLRTNLRQDNPAQYVIAPKTPPNFPNVMQLRDAELLLQQPDLTTLVGVRDAAIIATFIGCGFRMSGVTNLNDSSLIWTADEHNREVLIIRVCEKGKKERMVPAPDEVRLLIRAYLGHKELAPIIRDLDDGDKVLFVSTNNRNIPAYNYYGEARRISTKTVDDMLKKYGKRANIDPKVVHAHALRHLYGTELAESDVHILHMKALMGHVKTDTVDIYNRTALRKLRRESQKGNPLGKINTPVSQLLKELNK